MADTHDLADVVDTEGLALVSRVERLSRARTIRRHRVNRRAVQAPPAGYTRRIHSCRRAQAAQVYDLINGGSREQADRKIEREGEPHTAPYDLAV